MDLSAFPYLQGNYAPIDEERDFDQTQLRVEGVVPPNLLGAYMRAGANVAYQPNHYVYPLDGDGMIHAVYFKDGQVQYKNRWVQTSHLQTERKFNRTIYGSVGKLLPVPQEVIDAGGEPSPIRNTANTNVIYHGEKLLAMWEGGFPHLLNPDLSTVGLYDYGGLHIPRCARPRGNWCPVRSAGTAPTTGYRSLMLAASICKPYPWSLRARASSTICRLPIITS